MKIVSIVNYKGGVGKTTLTANLGARLAQLGYRILLIDSDPQTNLTLSLVDEQEYNHQYKLTHTLYHLYAEFINNNNILDLKKFIIKPNVINHYVNQQMDLLCSTIDLFKIINPFVTKPKIEDSTYHLRELNLQSILRRALQSIKNNYDFVFIDCSPSFDFFTQNALVASDYYLVPIKLDVLSKDGLITLLPHINDYVNSFNHRSSYDLSKSYGKINPQFLGAIANTVKLNKGELSGNHKKHWIEMSHVLNNSLFNTKLRVYPSVYYKTFETLVSVVIQTKKSQTIGEYIVMNEYIECVDEFLERINKNDK